MASKQEVKDFINSIAPIVVSVCNRKEKKILPSVCIAQACQETGYGTTEAMKKANGYFGIKVGSKAIHYGTAWKGKSYTTKTHEYYDGKTAEKRIYDFRAYDTIEEAIEDYYDLLGNNPRFKKAVGEKDPTKCIQYIVQGGYATHPNYISINKSIVKTNKLTQYDQLVDSIVWSEKVDDTSNVIFQPPKYKIGDIITVSSYYKSSTDSFANAIIKNSSGTIINVKQGTKNPYCFGIGKTPIGWCNDGDIRSATTGVKITESELYTVVSGDTISKIAKKYNTTVNNIINLNKDKYPQMKANYIRKGWKIIVK